MAQQLGGQVDIHDTWEWVRGSEEPLTLSLIQTDDAAFDYSNADSEGSIIPIDPPGSEIDLASYITVDTAATRVYQGTTYNAVNTTVTPTDAFWTSMAGVYKAKAALYVGLPDGGGGAYPSTEFRIPINVRDNQAAEPS